MAYLGYLDLGLESKPETRRMFWGQFEACLGSWRTVCELHVMLVAGGGNFSTPNAANERNHMFCLSIQNLPLSVLRHCISKNKNKKKKALGADLFSLQDRT